MILASTVLAWVLFSLKFVVELGVSGLLNSLKTLKIPLAFLMIGLICLYKGKAWLTIFKVLDKPPIIFPNDYY